MYYIVTMTRIPMGSKAVTTILSHTTNKRAAMNSLTSCVDRLLDSYNSDGTSWGDGDIWSTSNFVLNNDSAYINNGVEEYYLNLHVLD